MLILIKTPLNPGKKAEFFNRDPNRIESGSDRVWGPKPDSNRAQSGNKSTTR